MKIKCVPLIANVTQINVMISVELIFIFTIDL